jgi:16S rRNA (guanine527-N7)-methyltransferase
MLAINETLNLTKWVKDEQVLVHHLLDSAQCLVDLFPRLNPPQRWLDLGTGCGFPGVLLAAAFPGVEVTLLDSVAKKTKALETCLQGLGWKVGTLTGRAEEVGRDPRTRESWDGVLSRAVADLPVVLEYALPLLKPGGYLVNWMTEEQIQVVDSSQKALQELSGKIVKKKGYSLPGLTQTRALLFVEKVGKTSDRYPRPVGRPAKDPL